MTGEFDHQAVFDAAMGIAAHGGWRRVDLEAIAAKAGVEPGVLKSTYRDPTGILVALAREIDRQVEAEADDAFRDPEVPVRDRLMEILLLRLEAMQPYKPGIAALMRPMAVEPAVALRGLPALAGAMRASLQGVGVPVTGPCGLLRVQGLAAVFLDALRVWTADDSPDLAATQRRLHERLGQAEELARTLGLTTMETGPA